MNTLSASRRSVAPHAAGLAAAFAAVLAGTPSAARGQTITPAPAFNAERLSTLPRDEWITNGGTISNQRYSPLDLINRGNVAGSKGLWRAGLESGTGPGNSAQAQILVFDGVMYVSTGDNDDARRSTVTSLFSAARGCRRPRAARGARRTTHDGACPDCALAPISSLPSVATPRIGR